VLGRLQVVSLGLETITAFCASNFCMLKKLFGFQFNAVGISFKQSAVTPLRLTRGLPPGWQDIVLPKHLLILFSFCPGETSIYSLLEVTFYLSNFIQLQSGAGR
jgi:hypothetical protein